MKRKFSMFLNIAMLCLCVCAIAIGVYSAKQASLNVTGSIGFTAHNCNVDIVGYMYGHSLTPDGAPVAKPTHDSEKKYLVYGETKTSTGTKPLEVRGDSTKSLSFNINEITGSNTYSGVYFSDMGESGEPEEIKIAIQVTNKSEFNVIAKPNITASTSTGNKVAISADRSAVVIDKGVTTPAEITFSLRLLPDENGEYSQISKESALTISLKMNFEKTDKVSSAYKSIAYISEFTTGETGEQSTIKSQLGSAGSVSYSSEILCYAERFPYYVEMGTDPTNTYSTGKLRWLIVGTMDASDNITLLGAEDKAAFAEGLMLNKNYCLLSEKILYTESLSNNGISFQNAFTNSDPYLNTKYGVKANDYATSNIREYLKGNTVQRAAAKDSNGTYKAYGTPVNFLTTYNLTNDPLYSRIQARTLASLYNESAISGETAEMKTVPTSTTSTPVDTTADKFWLLSQTEMKTIFADDKSGSYYMSACTSVLGKTSAAHWWLRSPNSSGASRARLVYDHGFLDHFSVFDYSYGVRAAFKI